MKLYITNTSRHPESAVRWLANYAWKYVRSEAVRSGWVERFEKYPIALRITNCCHSYRGLFQHTSYAHAIRGFNRHRHGLDAMDILWDVLVRIGKPEKFPVNSTYARYKDMPEAKLNDWQEAVVGLCAHEMAHIKYDYSGGDRKGAEQNVEWIEIDCVEQFRRERSLFDEFLASELQRSAEKSMAMAAKKSPEAVAAKAVKDAEVKLAMWNRKAKLAATKIKKYTRALKRAQKKITT